MCFLKKLKKNHKPNTTTHLTTTSRTNLPRSVLAEQQVQQQILPPVFSQQDAFLQHTHPQQHVGRDEVEEDGDCNQYQDPSDEKSGRNKTKFYNDMMKNVLFNKEANEIKSKLTRLIKMYESIKKHNNQTETDTLIEEEIVEIKDENKKQKHKSKNNVEVIAMAIAEMS
ncbi:hypothetical protein GLOIN_2v1771939 [Rhizophagus clarus]|uniref:Uncharacterized protein n=1 Tax=Rhizophagus clarus TaxID=94130 RepID=A0A8H3LT65_9GLOM|nr:hypothetical protein GLOIN_2v1771939 [Rhizophagus clarus]